MEEETVVAKVEAAPRKRDEWEIKDDLRAVKRALAIFKDPERLKDVQEMITAQKATEKSLDAIVEGDLAKALGF